MTWPEFVYLHLLPLVVILSLVGLLAAGDITQAAGVPAILTLAGVHTGATVAKHRAGG